MLPCAKPVEKWWSSYLGSSCSFSPNRSDERSSILSEDKYWRDWPESRSQQVLKTCKISQYSNSCDFILQYRSYETFGTAFAQNWFSACLNCNAVRDTWGSPLLFQELHWLLPLKGWLSSRLAIGFCSLPAFIYFSTRWLSWRSNKTKFMGCQPLQPRYLRLLPLTLTPISISFHQPEAGSPLPVFSGLGIFWWAIHYDSWTNISEEPLVLYEV